MTIHGKSNTGMGSVSGLCSPQPLLARRHVQTLLVPAECITIRLDVHNTSYTEAWALGLEVSDPHTRELLALVVDPTVPGTTVHGRIDRIVKEVREAVTQLLDPPPF